MLLFAVSPERTIDLVDFVCSQGIAKA
jgi:hypothetical protein